ncbi:MAG: acyltransferase family protein [Vicinamibacterales bacterium]
MTHGSERLDSLDVFRGLAIAAMILVSTPGSWNAVYTPLDHAIWNGWTLTDLVFPFLLFAMGAAVPFALARRRGAHRIGRHVVRRTAILFCLGLVLNAIEAAAPLHWATFRIPGVLQRVALVFLAVAWLTEQGSLRLQVAIVGAALVGYWAALTLVPVPGAGAGVLTPEGNLASYIDRALLGRHLLNRLSDPEGLLSTIPAIASAMCGVFAGDWLRERHQPHHSGGLFLAGLIAMVAGLAWGRVFPINKNLWTSSFALFSAGLAAQALALCHWLVDVRGWRGWSHPLAAFGRNPLAAYFLSVGCDSLLTRVSVPGSGSLKGLVYRSAFVPSLRPCCGAEAASLGYAVVYVVLWSVILGEMYRRRIFLRI